MYIHNYNTVFKSFDLSCRFSFSFDQLCGVTLLQWLWCLSELCEVVSFCDLANMDCMIAAEMTYTLAVLLERAAESRNRIPC